jgi:hypothetical protein
MTGGKREGAGRPPTSPLLKKIPLGIKLPRWLVEWLRGQNRSQAVIIEEALCSKHNLKPPETKNEI